MAEVAVMSEVVLTAPATEMSDHHGKEFLGFGTCSPDTAIPPWFIKLFFYPKVKTENGEVTQAPYGLRKIESLLIDEGYMCGCESDVRSTIVMLILYWLGNKPVLFAEPLFLNEEENSVIFSHCGAAPLSLASNDKEACIVPMRLTGKGAVITFTVKPQEYTLAALSGRKGNYRLLIGYGKGVPTDLLFEGNPAKIAFKTPIKNIVEETTEEFGASRHWILVPGNYVSELTELAKLLSFKYKIIR